MFLFSLMVRYIQLKYVLLRTERFQKFILHVHTYKYVNIYTVN